MRAGGIEHEAHQKGYDAGREVVSRKDSLILMVARKVIKDEVAERKEVVMNNIREALNESKTATRGYAAH